MTFNEDIFENLFGATPVVKAAPKVINAFEDLRTNDIDVLYTPRYAHSKIPFMDFTSYDRRWVDDLIKRLVHIGSNRSDKIVMLGYATAKRAGGGLQTWQQYVEELYRDKTMTRKDYSEAQLKHIPTLIAQLSGKGAMLMNCNTLTFTNSTNGKVL